MSFFGQSETSKMTLGTEGRTDTEKLPISNFLWVIPFFYLLRSAIRDFWSLFLPKFLEVGKFSNTVAYVQLVKQSIISIIVRYHYTLMYQNVKVAIPSEAVCYILQTE